MQQDLFQSLPPEQQNILPHDGMVNYYGKIFPQELANWYYELFMGSIEWRRDEVLMFGKKIETKRKVAWYGEKPFKYTYSNVTKRALPWTEGLLKIKKATEERSGETYNSCLLNLYHDGSEGMSWHSDGEPDLKKNGAIASLSFGATRKFAFKHRESKETVSVILEHGSLLVMKGETQAHWLHRLPPTKKIQTPRVNLTFRTIVESA